MDKFELLTNLKDACVRTAGQQGFAVRQDVSLKTCDLLITNQCVGVFFAVASSESPILELWRMAQSEIAGVRDAPAANKLPRDLVLTLIAAKEEDQGLTNEIVTDPYICRKLVLYLNGHPVTEALELLPFWPAPEFEESSASLSAQTVESTLTRSGFDPSFVADLTRPLFKGIVSKIEKRSYSLRTTEKTQIQASVISSKKPVGSLKQADTRTVRISNLDLLDFRGLRKIDGGIDLSGDVVFVYGPNGTGKTSLFDALEWVATGSVERLSWDPDDVDAHEDSLINLFSTENCARVTTTLSTGDKISRELRIDGAVTNRINGKKAREDQMTKAFVHNEAPPGVDKGLLRRLIRHSHFLGQHSIREFITGGDERRDPAEYRFRILSQLFGRQDFVKTNDKLSRLLRELDSKLLTLREQHKIRSEGLQAIERSIQERTAVLEKRRAALKAGPLSSDLAQFRKRLEELEIYQGRRVEKGIEAPNVLSSYLVETEAALTARKENLQKEYSRMRFLVREMNERSKRVKRIQEINEQIQELKKKMSEEQNNLATLNKGIKERESELRLAKSKEGELSAALRVAEWSLDNGESFAEAKRQLVNRRKAHETLELRAAGAEKERLELMREKENSEEALPALRTKLIAIEGRRSQLLLLADALDSLPASFVELRNSSKSEMTLSEQLAIGQESLKEVSEKLATVETEFARLEAILAASSQQRQRTNDLVAELAEHVDSGTCPLCGQDHGSKGNLRDRIKDQLSHIPAGMFELTSQREQLRNQIDEFRRQLVTSQKQVKALSSKVDQAKGVSKEITSLQNRWRLLALQLGLLSNEDDFEQFIKEAKLDFKDEEYTDLRSAVADLEGKIENCTRRIAEHAQKQEQLGSEVHRSQEILKQAVSKVDRLSKEASDLGIEIDVYDAKKADKNRNSAAGALEVERGKVSQVEQGLASAKEKATKVTDSLELLRSKRDILKKEQIELLAAEDTLQGELTAEQLPIDSTEQAVNLRLLSLQKQIDSCVELQRERDRLYEAVSIEQLSLDIDMETKLLKEESEKLAPTEARIKLFDSWKAELTDCTESIRAEQKVGVEQQVEELAPTINKIWKRLSPHPVFDDIRMEIIRRKGKDSALRIKASVNGSTMEIGQASQPAVPPSSYFSEAQINVLALSIFLAIAVRQSWSGLRLIAIDDPVQQMDDLNANAFFDLIRGLVPSGHQFLIATCDQQLYRMALEKFACLNVNGKTRFVGYRLKGVSRKGPQVIRDVP